MQQQQQESQITREVIPLAFGCNRGKDYAATTASQRAGQGRNFIECPVSELWSLKHFSTFTHIHVHTYIYIYMCVCNIYIYIYIHTFIHTYIYVYLSIYAILKSGSRSRIWKEGQACNMLSKARGEAFLSRTRGTTSWQMRCLTACCPHAMLALSSSVGRTTH